MSPWTVWYIDFVFILLSSFAQADIHDYAADLVGSLLSKIESAGTAEKVAENDHLMKCSFDFLALEMHDFIHCE